MAEIVSTDPVEAFLQAATWHGTLDAPDAILAAIRKLRPTVFTLRPYWATRRMCVVCCRRCGQRDAAFAAVRRECTGLPVSFQLPPPGQVAVRCLWRAATALLDAGASPNSSFWSTGDYPELESASMVRRVAHDADSRDFFSSAERIRTTPKRSTTRPRRTTTQRWSYSSTRGS